MSADAPQGVSAAPAVVRWPGVIKPGTVINDIFSHLDWMPTIMAAAGEPDIKEKLLKGHEAAGKKFKVHLDGYDQTALLKGEGPGARKEIFYITDDGDLSAFRYDKWKVLFTQQKSTGMDVWREPLSPTRMPILVDLHADPFEAAVSRGHSYEYDKWAAEGCLCSSPLRPSWRSSLGPSRSIRQGKSRPASALATLSNICKQPRRADKPSIQPSWWRVSGRPPYLPLAHQATNFCYG